MTGTNLGRVDWSMSRTKEGHRDYKLKWLIETTSPLDGPTTILQTPGLPTIGSTWYFGNDNDPWAFCWPECSITPYSNDPDPQTFWFVEQTFSTQPLWRCGTATIENPLLEPLKISGTYAKYTREMQKDRFGKLLRTSAGELFSGPMLEVDESRPTVSISWNSLTNQVPIFSPYMDTVNDATLWGLAPRKIKLSGASWERKLYGVCTFYYTTTLEFHVHPRTFDRKIPDYGSYVLKLDLQGGTDAECDVRRKDWRNIEQYQDWKGENAKCFLDGHGRPLPVAMNSTPAEVKAEFYEEKNFLLLGVPTSL